MQVTRRYWTAVALAASLAVWAVVLERQLLLLGAVALTSWLLTRQYRFVRTTRSVVGALGVTQRIEDTRVAAGRETVGELSVQAEEGIRSGVVVETTPPTGGDGTGARVSLKQGSRRASGSFELQWPVAGSFTVPRPTAQFRDSLGLFGQRVPVGTESSVTVEPRAPRDPFIGERDKRVPAGLGEHETEESGSGLTPAEIRKYQPGDTPRRIDWNATARRNELYVREFETESELSTLLVFDHRATMGTGRDRETKLDYARQVALAIVGDIRERGDALGWYAVGDRGLTETFAPSPATNQHRLITKRLRSLEPTVAEPEGQSDWTDPAQARRTATRLDGETAFDRKLKPFLSDTNAYVKRFADQPLFGGLRTAETRIHGDLRTILITDDRNQTELRETVRNARRGNGEVVVFLTPSVLFEAQSLADVDDAYRRYQAFEDFREELGSLSRVTVFEVSPSERLATVLAADDSERGVPQ